MSEFDAVGYLAGKGHHGRSVSGGKEMAYACFMDCDEPRGSRKLKLYVNASDGWFSCLAGATRVITSRGTFSISSLAGGTHSLLTTGGRWVDAPVLSFGRRPLWKIDLVRDQTQKSIYATADHRWLVDGRERSTIELRVGTSLDSVVAESWRQMSSEGIAAGVTFGDGTAQFVDGKRRSTGHVTLWGRKVELQEYVEPFGTTVIPLSGADIKAADGVRADRSLLGVRINGTPGWWKSLPTMYQTNEYLLGWVSGYVATDGTVGRTNISIDCASPIPLERVREACNRLGLVCGSVKCYRMAASVIAPEHDMYRVSIHRSSLWSGFFLRSDHRRKFDLQTGGGNARIRWRITSVVSTDRTEEVYCAVVPGSETFALEGNILTGNCKVCCVSGGSYLLQKFFGDEPEKVGAPPQLELRREILMAATEVGMEMLANNEAAMLYLMDDRGLDPETIVERKLGYVGNGWSLIESLKKDYPEDALRATGLCSKDPGKPKDFFFRHILIPYLHLGSTTQIRGRVFPEEGFKGGKYWTGPGVDADLYAREELLGADDVLVCEGEIDAMSVRQALATCPDLRLRNMAVVGCPGADTITDKWLPYFEDAKRIHLGLDPDVAGKRSALRLKELFGNRSRIVCLPEELPKCDWSSFLSPVPPGAPATWHREHPHAGHDWRDIQRIVVNASGRRLFTMAEAGASWRQYKDEHPQGVKTGFSQLDAIIEPGLLPGQLCILLARTGVGKSIFLCNLAMNMLNRRVLFITLEMTREEIYERLRRIYLFWYPLATDPEVEDAFSRLMICDENKLNETSFRQLVDEYTLEKGEKPEVAFVDYLGYYARGQRGGSPYEKTSAAVMQLKAEAKAHRISIITPHQVNRTMEAGRPIDLDGARDSGSVSETGDFVLAAFRPDDAQQIDGHAQPTGKIRLQVLKSRHGGANQTISLQMDLLSLVIVDDGFSAAKKAQEHNFLFFRGKKWEDMRALELAPVQTRLRVDGG